MTEKEIKDQLIRIDELVNVNEAEKEEMKAKFLEKKGKGSNV